MRNCLRYSFRTLFLVVLAVAVALGWFSSRWRQSVRQKKAMSRLAQKQDDMSVGFSYSYRFDDKGQWSNTNVPGIPKRLREVFGDDFFYAVESVELSRTIEDDLPPSTFEDIANNDQNIT